MNNFKLGQPVTCRFRLYRYKSYRSDTRTWEETGPTFISKGPRIKIALVVPSDRTNPIPVPFERMKNAQP